MDRDGQRWTEMDRYRSITRGIVVSKLRSQVPPPSPTKYNPTSASLSIHSSSSGQHQASFEGLSFPDIYTPNFMFDRDPPAFMLTLVPPDKGSGALFCALPMLQPEPDISYNSTTLRDAD